MSRVFESCLKSLPQGCLDCVFNGECEEKQLYEKGRADAYKELAPLFEDIVTMDNICEVLDGEWCEKNCGNTDKCLAKYVEQLKQSN